jgi:ferredoxin
MNSKDITLIYFSPTDTTRTVLEEIAKGLGKNDYNVIDTTKSEIRTQPAPVFNNDLVLIGAPVYGGRLPKDSADYFKAIKASNSMAVLVVLYGNREFEDALLEMKNISIDSGFIPLAGCAFIGEHSFSNDGLPIAKNRPDEDDLKKAFLFGKQVTDLVNSIENTEDIIPVHVPGNFPYKDGIGNISLSFITVTEACDDCGICVDACPKDAIDETNDYSTIDENCIFCCACIKSCPQEARVMKDGPFKDKAKWLYENCAHRKEPQLFLSGE